MPRDGVYDRRTFLQYGGATAATATTMGLAGCPGSESESDGDGDGEGDGDGDGGSPTPGDGEDAGTETAEEPNVPDEFEITITQGTLPDALDPHDHRETPVDTVMLHVYEGVLRRSADGQLQNGLATGYDRVEDGHVRFTIREGVQFHNGDDLTPADVAYTINRMVDDDVGFASRQSDQLAGVTGASVADDGRTVDVTSDGYNPVVFAAFGTYCDVVKQSWIEERDQEEINRDMNGTGPFELDSFEQGVEIVLRRNENYWDDLAPATQVTFTGASESSTRVNQLLAGESDVVTNVPPQDLSRVRNESSTRTEAAPSTRLLFNGMRYDVEPFSSLQFRRAMNYAVDLESIVSNVLQGFGAQTSQPTLEGFTGYNPDLDPYSYDPEEAERLVEESGHAGVEIELHTPNGRYLQDFEIAQAVVGYVDDLPNVSASVNQREFGNLAGELTDGDIETAPDWFLIGWGEATFDGGLVINSLLTTDGTVSSYSDEEIDSMMAEAASQPPDEREATLREVNRLLHERAPWIFLNRQFSVYGVSERINWSARRDERIDAYEMQPS